MERLEVVHGYKYEMDAPRIMRLSFMLIDRLLTKGIVTSEGAEYLRKEI